MRRNKDNPLQLSMAQSFDERCGAFALINRCYSNAGLSEDMGQHYRVTKYQLLLESRVFISKLADEVVATVSLIPDTAEHGLPMDMIYSAELDILRAKGKRIAEVGCLADRRRDPRRFIDNFCNLTRLMAQYSVQQSIDGFVIMVHPRHAKFYKTLNFKEVGGLTNYPVVGNLPAVALFLEFEVARIETPRRYSLFFDDKVEPDSISNGQMQQEEVNYFQNYVINAEPQLFCGEPEFASEAV